ncbi:RdRP [Allexivirus sigmamedicagonis]|uniref:RdRP n=1 Tax=Allexivirus sigmamedicagonis TaxID=1985968 RepID=A0A1X9PY63_9VIRU|nr:RdRP [Alfalfa virus S]ARQ03275.1 RdRP [Alfalfa virus S]
MATRVRKLLDEVTDPSTKAAYSELCFKHAREAAKQATKLAPYVVSDAEALTLERLGITTSPFATTSHTHASDKILENDCLSIIGHQLPKDPITFIQLKKGKLHLLNRGPGQDRLVNYCHEPKDVLRYGITHPHVCPRVDTKYAVLADTLHFMSTKQLLHLFTQNPKLERLFATLVLPIEAVHRLPSLYPEIYYLEYYDDCFAYMPGGHAGGAYVHSYGTLRWLEVGQIGTHTNRYISTGQTDYLTLEKIETKAAHHIMLVQRRRPNARWLLAQRWVFKASTFVRLPPVFYPPEANVQNTYPHDLIKRAQLYCLGVKAVSLRDIFSKFRQIIETTDLARYSMADLIRLANYLLLTTGMQQVSDYECLLTSGLIAKLSAKIRIRFNQLLESLRGKSSYAALLTVTDVIPVPFTTKPKVYPAEGESWFTGKTDEDSAPEIDDGSAPPEESAGGPTLEDLELIADMEKALREAESPPKGKMADEQDQAECSSKTMTEAAHLQVDAVNGDGLSNTDAESDTTNSVDEQQRDVQFIASAEQAPNIQNTTLQVAPPQAQLPSMIANCKCGMEVILKQLPQRYQKAKLHFEYQDQLNGREAVFFARIPDAVYEYPGGRHQSQGWPDTLDMVLQDCGQNPESFDHCLVQRYERGAAIPFHRDNEPVYPLDNPILTVNLVGKASFELQCKRGEIKIPLSTAEYFIMPNGCQRTHRHAVRALTHHRVSLTFRSTKRIAACLFTGEDTHMSDDSHFDRATRKHSPDQPATLNVAETKQPDDTQAEERAATPKSNSFPPFPRATIEILQIHGFKNLRPQSDGTGPIQPVHWNPNTQKLVASEPSEEAPHCYIYKLAERLKRKVYRYHVDNKRATSYMSDVKNNLTGLVLPKLDRATLSAWVSLCENSSRDVDVLVIHGAGGAGKSRALQEMLRSRSTLREEVNIILPTIVLAQDWKTKMTTMDPRRFMTFEKACERESKEIAIFDDYGKLPAGYIDAYIAIKPNVEMIILTGDQRQSVHHNANGDAQTAGLSSNIDHFSRYCDYYLNATHRQPRRLANPIQVHAEREFGGAVMRAALLPDKATILVPSQISRMTASDLGRKAYTYAGCQGLTLPHVVIALDKDTPGCSKEVLYTAFSRASESITFVNTFNENPAFLAKLDATPYLKTLLSGVREDEWLGRDEPPTEYEPKEPNIKTHLPVANDETFLDDLVEAMEDKDTRELWSKFEKTNLMQTENKIVQLFPHQQAKDEALFRLTIDKRIRLASPEENEKAMARTLSAGNLLFEAYADFMKVPADPQPFDRDLWEHCKQLAQRTYISKPTSNLQQGATRQDPDFPANAIALFNKSQWVKKLEKVGFKFKPGQTISAFKQSTVLLTTTYALYLRKKREQHQPDNVFIMCEKTPNQFNDFVLTRFDFSQPSYTSDYEQYDQSQDGAFLNFELRKARHFGVPEEVINFYRFIKLNAKTFLGNLAIMRLSGEGPTFDANTECNIAYDALRFQLHDAVNACYAGDDLVRDHVCPERSSWMYSQHLFSLVAKPKATLKPDFCGWRLTPFGIVKSPYQLKTSLELAIQLKKLEDMRRSYAIDYQFAYKLQDRLYQIFDEKEMEAHQLVTRVLIKHGATTAHTGDHLPTFHITSDRLILNPHKIEMHDAAGDRAYLETPVTFDNYIQ